MHLLTLEEASQLATQLLGKTVTVSNIAYLVHYGRVKKYGANGTTRVDQQELEDYYQKFVKTQESAWKQALGHDLNWRLSFSDYKEAQTTKHVHRLHPYKGKFIPQLVEYFLDGHVDRFKTAAYFNAGDIVLDPFCGSGTTLVQANELGMHAIGIDISRFNALISNVKTRPYDLAQVHLTFEHLIHCLSSAKPQNQVQFESELTNMLSEFNQCFFPTPDFRRAVREKSIDEKQYGQEKASEFLSIYQQLVAKHGIRIQQNTCDRFLEKWFLYPTKGEIDLIANEIEEISVKAIRELAMVTLSRTLRSCRATTHADLGTLKEPVIAPYYCKKHGKICKPVFSMLPRWRRYCQDALNRLKQFNELRTPTCQFCLTGDGRQMAILPALHEVHAQLFALTSKQKIRGIFSSPPYVGLIDYHEQHAYAYDLFDLGRQDQLEIGAAFKGQSKIAKKAYIQDIAAVLAHCKPLLQKNYDIFLVANDKYQLYPEIADKAGLHIVNNYKRPVLNRVEKNRSAYAETVFHMREKR